MRMAPKPSKKKLKRLKKQDLRGFKYFRVLADLTEHLHEVYIDPKHPNKRKLHYDQYLSLMLLYMFSPICDSLRMVQQATELEKVQKIVGVPRFGRGTISDAGKIFNPQLLKGVIGQLAERVPDGPMGKLLPVLQADTRLSPPDSPVGKRAGTAVVHSDHRVSADRDLHRPQTEQSRVETGPVLSERLGDA